MQGEIADAGFVGPPLRTVAGSGGAFEGYMQNEFAPALDAGVRPPFREGFARFRSALAAFWRSRRARRAGDSAKTILAERYAKGEITPEEYRERLATLGEQR